MRPDSSKHRSSGSAWQPPADTDGAAGTRAIVLHPVLPVSGQPDGHAALRAPESRLEEAVGLAHALELEVVDQGIVTIARIRPSTLLGQGKVEELAGVIAANKAELVVVDGPLSPVQQRNLERAWNAKVLDRTGLILEIFAARAQTREGRLQVELAHLTYQKSRLVRSWTHLERQRGGLGFVGGPGETQIEADRRMIQDRITALKRELRTVSRTRALHRAKRAKVPYPVVALVGYTNAGKSTLFNRLTDAAVRAEDLLFATLDPTMRRIHLQHGAEVILSDTVGFVSDLPTHLVAAFRATLEEVVNADLILHVRDVEHPDTGAQAEDVATVMAQLQGDSAPAPILEVWNKIDALEPARRDALIERANARDDVAMVSALTGEGIPDLLDVIESRLAARSRVTSVEISAAAGRDIHWLYEHCEVLDRDDRDEGTVHFSVRVPPHQQSRFEKRFS